MTERRPNCARQGRFCCPTRLVGDRWIDFGDFAGYMEEMAAGLRSITPPADLSSLHSVFVERLTAMARELEVFAGAVEEREASVIADSATWLSTISDEIEQAETELEGLLGMQITSG